MILFNKSLFEVPSVGDGEGLPSTTFSAGREGVYPAPLFPAGKSGAGFTLIELLVSIALLSIIILIVIGVFSQFTVSQRREIAEQELQEDMRLVFDLFNREVRTSYGASLSTASSDTRLRLRNQNGRCIEYALIDGAVVRTEATGSETATSCELADYGSTAARVMTDEQTVVETLVFEVQPATVEDDLLLSQGYVTIRVRLRSAADAAMLQVQTTTASQQTVPYTLPDDDNV